MSNSDKEQSILAKFDEDTILEEMHAYIAKTYSSHYSGRTDAFELIRDAGHGEGFCVGNIIKYASRYGKKDGKNRNDILKIIHYTMMLLHVHDINVEKPI